MTKSSPVVHLTFSDESRRIFATAVSTSVGEDCRWVARCEAAGVLFQQGFEEEAKAVREHLVRAGYAVVGADDVLGRPLFRRG